MDDDLDNLIDEDCGIPPSGYKYCMVGDDESVFSGYEVVTSVVVHSSSLSIEPALYEMYCFIDTDAQVKVAS